jgi:hypothetical protein
MLLVNAMGQMPFDKGTTGDEWHIVEVGNLEVDFKFGLQMVSVLVTSDGE